MTSNQQSNTQQTAPVLRTLDPVKKDGVLKELVKSENEAKEIWEKKWKFMFDFQKYCVEEAVKEGFTEEEFRKLQTNKKQYSHQPLHGWKFEPSEKFPVTSSESVLNLKPRQLKLSHRKWKRKKKMQQTPKPELELVAQTLQ